MRVILFGATGMVGQGVLRECLRAPDVTEVLAVGRTATGLSHAKLRELVQADLYDLKAAEARLTGWDACFFCLGISVAGLTEAAYSRLTYDLTVSVAQTLSRLNPGMTFTYVSGASTDSSEQGPVMWARVKGRTENALLALPFKGAYMFRPGIIQPMNGERSKTLAYRIAYVVLAPLMPVVRWRLGDKLLNTEIVGRAMLEVVRHGAPQRVLEVPDIARLGALRPASPD